MCVVKKRIKFWAVKLTMIIEFVKKHGKKKQNKFSILAILLPSYEYIKYYLYLCHSESLAYKV